MIRTLSKTRSTTICILYNGSHHIIRPQIGSAMTRSLTSSGIMNCMTPLALSISSHTRSMIICCTSANQTSKPLHQNAELAWATIDRQTISFLTFLESSAGPVNSGRATQQFKTNIAITRIYFLESLRTIAEVVTR